MKAFFKWMKLIFKWLEIGVGAILILEQILGCFGLLPYRIERVFLSSIQPNVYLFPGQSVRLAPEFPDGLRQEQVEQIQWTLEKGERLFQVEGYQPTIGIPPGEGGIYNLSVVAKTAGVAASRTGRTSIYVVQDEVRAIELKKPTSAQIDPAFKADQLNKTIQSKGVEVFYANGEWKPAQTSTSDDGSGKILLPAGSAIKTEDGRVFYRAKGEAENLRFYGTARLPVRADK